MPNITATSIALEGVSKSFDKTTVIPGLNAVIEPGSFTVILGPSGCGKTTLLDMIAGLEPVTSGRIHIGGREVQDEAPKDRGIAMVFQSYALYPHMSVAGNIGYSLKVAGVAKDERHRRVEEAARVVELGDYLDRRPSQLSGGQRQRVAIARAIVRAPKVLLFDEPLSNLDARLRQEMRMELRRLHGVIGATSVFVTHDQVEAMTLADRIMILNAGRIEQYASPAEIYNAPASTFVAGFIGGPPMNLLDVTGQNGRACLTDGTVVGPVEATGPAILGIRPERVVLAEEGVPAEVVYHEDLGANAILMLRLSDGQELRVTTVIGAGVPVPSRVHVRFPADALHFFDVQTGRAVAREKVAA